MPKILSLCFSRSVSSCNPLPSEVILVPQPSDAVFNYYYKPKLFLNVAPVLQNNKQVRAKILRNNFLNSVKSTLHNSS